MTKCRLQLALLIAIVIVYDTRQAYHAIHQILGQQIERIRRRIRSLGCADKGHWHQDPDVLKIILLCITKELKIQFKIKLSLSSSLVKR